MSKEGNHLVQRLHQTTKPKDTHWISQATVYTNLSRDTKFKITKQWHVFINSLFRVGLDFGMSYLTSMEGHDPQSLQFFMMIKATLIILEIPIRFTSTMNLISSNPSLSNFLWFQIFLSDWTLCLPWVWSKRFSHKTWNYIEIFWSKKL